MGNAVCDGRLERRITLTHPPLESSRRATFLVAGAKKREILGLLPEVDCDLPSPRLAAVGKMRLFADTAATGRSAP
jgi:6-phosphogluconolactonase/glucosamine-6-phosphate isomerase/deaminase